MPSNVIRILAKPCVPSPQRRALHITSRLCNGNFYVNDVLVFGGNEEYQRREEEMDRLLQVEDQAKLREAIVSQDELIAQLRNAKKNVPSIPRIVQVDPTIPPYTLSLRRNRPVGGFAEEANKAIKEVENVRQHLVDLKYQPYGDKGNNALVQFEKSLEDLSTEEKEELLTNLRNQDTAKRSRALASAQILYDRVTEMKERLGGRVVARQNPFAGKEGADEAEEEDEVVESAEEPAPKASGSGRSGEVKKADAKVDAPVDTLTMRQQLMKKFGGKA